jgi:hypothetical protein
MHRQDDTVVYSAQIVYVLFSDDLLVMFGGLRTLPAEQARLRIFADVGKISPERKGGSCPKIRN